jgi:hypothetical protein
MNDSRFMVGHVRLATERAFEDVAEAFERPLGRFDQSVVDSLRDGKMVVDENPAMNRWAIVEIPHGTKTAMDARR